MTIRNNTELINSLWDWACLAGCFGDTLIAPMDVDGAIERKGKFLWLETKKMGAPIPLGQLKFYKALADRGDSVIWIWGSPGKPERLEIWTASNSVVIPRADMESLRQFVMRWWVWADRG